MMGSMRHLKTVATFLFASAAAMPAFAMREQAPLKASSASFMAVLALMLVVALIVGASMMNPRRTHQD